MGSLHTFEGVMNSAMVEKYVPAILKAAVTCLVKVVEITIHGPIISTYSIILMLGIPMCIEFVVVFSVMYHFRN